jgi:hypothetical protein
MGGVTADPKTTAAEAAAQLRAVLAAIDAGEIEAEPTQRAHLQGAADALEAISGPNFTENDRLP